MTKFAATFLAIVLVAVGESRFSRAANPEPPIVPAVQQWHGAAGQLDVRGAAIVVASADEKLLRPTAELLKSDLVRLGLPRPEIAVGKAPEGKPAIVLALSDKPFAAAKGTIEEQSYSVDIGKRSATIAGHNRAGIFFGTRSLLQMAAVGKGNVSCGRIVDGPITRQRMLMLDVGRKAFPIETLYDYLRILGWYKMNELHLHLSDSAFDNKYAGFRVQCDTFPGLTSKDCFYTKRQLREFQDTAAAMGITVTPEIDMPGHAACFTLYWPELALKGKHGNLDVMNPKTIERMKQVLDEMIPLFDAPDFHIGTDEYPVGNRKEATPVNEAFRRFINTMNAYVRAKGKNCRVWDGWEHYPGKTEIDPTVIVDMWWGIYDTNAYIRRGHKVINACQFTSYVTSGRPTYGVNNAHIYNNWQPNYFGKHNPPLGDPNVIGAKLHVWVGQGPSGWTMTEIADLTVPSLVAYSEKMWGRKGSPNYQEFLKRAARVEPVPGVTVYRRIAAKDSRGLVLDQPEEVTLTAQQPTRPLPLAQAARADLEFPWTLTMEVKKTAVNGRGVILSSQLAEICDAYSRREGKRESRTGFGVVRASGNWGPTPAQAKMAAENSRVYTDSLPLDKWVRVAVVATRKHTAVYFDGKLVGQQNQQMLCPLRRYGSTDASAGFRGSIKNLRVVDRALSGEELARPPRSGK